MEMISEHKTVSGYEQTEVGVIPAHWRVKTLGALTILLTNGFVGKVKGFYVNSGDGVLYVQGYNVQENGFNFHGICRVSKQFHAAHQKSCLEVGDLLTIQTGDIGVTAIVPPDLAGANCHALVISRLRRQEAEPTYYCQYFNSERGRAAFKRIETGSTMKHLNVGQMVDMPVPCPPLPEQRAIGEALSDIDFLIETLDKFIAKKRDLKQAAMQQLLSGKKRLPRFSDEWKMKRLGKIAKLYQPMTISQAMLKEDGYLVYGANGIIGRYDKYNHEHWQTIITCRGSTCGTVSKTEDRVWITGNAMVVNCDENEKIDKLFLFYLLCFQDFSICITGSGQPQIIRGPLFEYSLRLPSSLAEQRAIAGVLSSIDSEIVALEQRRDKTRALKQGMMQELLTGKTRLI